MLDVMSRYRLWLEAVDCLLAEHHRGIFPRLQISEVIDTTFTDASTSEWAWAQPDGSLGGEFSRLPPGPDWPESGPPTEWVVASHEQHPLLSWFRASGDSRPMSSGRVPPSVVSVLAQQRYRAEVGAPMGLGHQLSIPYVLQPGRYRAFLLARTDDDFPDEDLDLARRIQPLLELLNLHVTSRVATAFEPAQDARLTPRETTVLSLLADGATAYGIARKLQVSPRTVHNHLQRVYRKLAVHDRMGAVIRAQSLGILEPWPAQPAGPVVTLQAGAGRPDNVIPIDRGVRSGPRRSFAYAIDPDTGRLVEVS